MQETTRLVIIILSVLFFVNTWSSIAMADDCEEISSNLEVKYEKVSSDLQVNNQRFHELTMLIARTAVDVRKLTERIDQLERENAQLRLDNAAVTLEEFRATRRAQK